VGRTIHIAIWMVSALLALVVGMLETPRLFVLIALMGEEAAFRTMLFTAADKGVHWPLVALMFPVFLLIGYFVPAYVPLPRLWGKDRKKEV
jgi:hypothetical protein